MLLWQQKSSLSIITTHLFLTWSNIWVSWAQSAQLFEMMRLRQMPPKILTAYLSLRGQGFQEEQLLAGLSVQQDPHAGRAGAAVFGRGRDEEGGSNKLLP